MISYEDENLRLPEELESRLKEKTALLKEKIGKENRTMSLYFCKKETMQELNREYREKNRPTDILSWVYEENEKECLPGDVWGEIVLCTEICREQATASKLNLESELIRLLVHGLAHLTGYNHEISAEEEKRMLEFEQDLLKSIGFVDIY